MTEPLAIAEYLKKLPGVSEAIPLEIRVFNTRFPAARYTQTTAISPGCHAYDRGERETTRTCIYVAGVRPAKMQKRIRLAGNDYCQKHVYRLPGDERDWYVVCYADAISPEHNQSHPFGPSFILGAWSVPDGTAIDEYEDRKRERVMVGVSAQVYHEENGTLRTF